MKNKTNIILLVALLGMLIYLFTQPTKPPIDVSPYLKKVETLQQQNDSLQEVNQSLDQQVDGLERQADSLTSLVQLDQKIINHLKIKAHEKLKAIDGYDHTELLGFFSGLNTDSTAHRK